MSATDDLAKILRDTITNDVVTRIKAIQKDGGNIDDLVVDVTAETVVDGMIKQLRGIASQFLDDVWLVVNHSYDYNDEYYYTPEGDPYYVVAAYADEAQANESCKARLESTWITEQAGSYYESYEWCEEGETVAQMNQRLNTTDHAPKFFSVVKIPAQ